MELLFLVAVASGIFCAFIASEKGRSGFAWFLLGMLFPIIALLAVIGVPSKRP